MNRLKVKLHYKDMPLPSQAHEGDAGLDLTLMEVIEKRENVFFFDTGVSVEPPKGYYTVLVPRSSIYKTDFVQANSVGIIDHGYRGVIYMPMRYVGHKDGLIEARKLIGTRIGQLILQKLEPFTLELSEDLNDSSRGEGGFGSTGG